MSIFRQFLLFSRYSHFKIHYLENVCHRHDLHHLQWRHSMANIPDFLSGLMFALSLTICEIFRKVIKEQEYDLQNEGQFWRGRKRDLRHSTRCVLFHMREFFEILATWEHTSMQKVTHTHKYTYTKRETRVMTTGKISKQICKL